MRKLALGKGLRALLNGTPVPGQPKDTPSVPASLDDASLSPGVGSLLRGERKAASSPEAEKTFPPAEVAPSWQKWALVKWVLLAADILLLTLASILVFKTSGPLNFLESLLCCSSLGIGAILALLALGTRSR